MKKFILICLSFFMFASSFTVYADEEYKENSWRYENGEPIASQDEISYARSSVNAWSKQDGVIYNSLGDPIPNAISKGIDVSEWQGDIDWNKVKNTDVEFAIIRCGFAGDYTKYDDKKFQRNVSECQRLGIPFGIYLYSYAETVEDAKSEASHVLRLLNNMQLAYPVFYDLEENNVMATVSKSTIASIAKTFVTTIQSHGYNCGIYANLNWFNNFLTDSYFDTVTKWIAQYNTECTYTKPYNIWQATSSGYVNGVQGRVDINIGFDSMKKCGWIKTNGLWWYRYEDGSYPSSRFDVIDGNTYYFNVGGYIVTGWNEINGYWYYFNTSGAMVKNQWIGNYYVGSDGKMLTSQWIDNYYVDSSGLWQPNKWIKTNGLWWYRYGDGSYPSSRFDVIDGNTYYFNVGGYIVTGWNEINGYWYYFNTSGAMVKNQWIGNYYIGSDGYWII